MDSKILLTDFTLDKYTEAKLPEQTFDVIFENELQFFQQGNAQEKCSDLIFPFSRSSLKYAAIKNVNILSEPRNDSVYTKEIREITLDCTDLKEFDWQPGDTIAIVPNNANECVDYLLKLLALDDKSDTICSVKISKLCTKKNVGVPAYIRTPTTPRQILRDCLNLKSVLKKAFLRSLAEFCGDNDEKNFLKCLSSKEATLFYNELIIKNGFTLTDILKVCGSCKPPFSLIVQHLPRLLPRPYSITNSPLKTRDEITIIFSTLENNSGVTTRMLKEKCSEESSSLLIYLREPNYFRYTEDNYHQNQILIAIGTGLAPFLGFLEHKQLLNNQNKERAGVTWLFVGTTAQEAVIHRKKLLQWHSKNILDNFVESYSRAPTARFHYMQDALDFYAQELVELLLKPETYLYLCADAGQISKSIENCLRNILVKELIISETESSDMLKDFKNKRKFIEDIWL